MSQILDVRPEDVLFARTVDRALVHRAVVSEVLLTDCRPVGELDFVLGAQWPRGHGFYLPVGDRWYDPVLMAETVRQAGLVIAHTAFGVPLDRHFLMWDVAFEADPAALAFTGTPANLSLMATCEDVRRRGTGLAGMRIRVHVLRDGRALGTATGALSCTTPGAYRRLRGERLAAALEKPLPPLPVPPPLVGRDRAADVVLAPTGAPHVWEVRSERGHPVLFDHEVDHLPGMVLVEAMRQAVCLATGWPAPLVTALSASFLRYVEFGEPCLVRAEVGAASVRGTSVEVVMVQGGETVARGSLRACPTG
ncbi:A-factor biosynthesis hotdog protein [Streptomyces sp. TLI_235]|nr:ScbA/BarX family gamma-butyrolactone biosynthesis protein [Streptomyces sp. TLI_235]PBC76722.1 A-factor biosynthesis hotdog protein [Streptomyces sp. TLI_235]